MHIFAVKNNSGYFITLLFDLFTCSLLIIIIKKRLAYSKAALNFDKHFFFRISNGV